MIGLAYLLAVMIAIPLGVLTAARQYTCFDHFFTGLSFVGFSLPTFFTGVLLIILFSVKLRLVTDGLQPAGHRPARLAANRRSCRSRCWRCCQAATLNRYVRASMLDNLNQDYARTARAKGLAERIVVTRHVLRNALVPVVTLIALQLPDRLHGRGRDRADLPGAGDRRAADLARSRTMTRR